MPVRRSEVKECRTHQASCAFSFEIPLHKLREGDNPIYIRVDQVDGHVAWSSPIYVVA